jgi:hypothetical protein
MADSVLARSHFDNLRSQFSLENRIVAETIDSLEQLSNQRRELDRQMAIHRLLHYWLYAHVPLAWALMGLLGVHILSACMSWGGFGFTW